MRCARCAPVPHTREYYIIRCWEWLLRIAFRFRFVGSVCLLESLLALVGLHQQKVWLHEYLRRFSTIRLGPREPVDSADQCPEREETESTSVLSLNDRNEKTCLERSCSNTQSRIIKNGEGLGVVAADCSTTTQELSQPSIRVVHFSYIYPSLLRGRVNGGIESMFSPKLRKLQVKAASRSFCWKGLFTLALITLFESS